MKPARGGDFAFTGDFQGPLGLQLWSVRDALAVDVPGTLARVRAFGFEQVELAGTCGLSAGEFRQALGVAGLRAMSMHVPFERMTQAPEAVWDEAACLGVRYVGIPNLPAPRGRLTPEVLSRGAEALNVWGEGSRARGLCFFLHTHGPELRVEAGDVLPLDTLAARTDPALVAFQLDVRWAMQTGLCIPDLVRRYPDRRLLLHLRDVDEETGIEDVALGAGCAEIPAVLAAAAAAGVEAYFLEDEAPQPWPRIAQSVVYLEALRLDLAASRIRSAHHDERT